jgi:hypothetical protein
VLYVVAFSVPYPIPSGLERPLLHFGRLTGGSVWPTLAYVAAILGLFALYLVGLRFCRGLEGRRSAHAVVVGFGVLAALVLLPMYPVFSLDVFYYMAADRIWTVYRENPFVVPPLQAAHDPFFPYTTWGHYTLPYGPLWPWVSAIASRAGGGEIGQTLLAFKALGVAGYLLCLPAVSWAVAGLSPNRRLLGIAIFAWNPLVLLELAGGGHNDAIALIPAALALGFWVRKASAAAALAIVVSFLVKATIAVLAPALLWAGFRRAVSSRTLPLWFALHVVPGLALIVLAWAPFWSVHSTGGLGREVEQYYHSLTAVILSLLPQDWRATALRTLQGVLLIAFAVYGLTQLRHLSTEDRNGARALWRVLIFYFAVVGPYYAGWYMMWPTLIAAVLAERRTALLTAALCLGSLATYVVEFFLRPAIGQAIGWAMLNALAVLAAFGPFVALWWILSRQPSKPVTMQSA